MERIVSCILAIVVVLLPSFGLSQQLTRSSAKGILDKVAAQISITQITLNANTRGPLQSVINSLGAEEVLENLGVDTAKQCLPDPSDVRIMTGQFVHCQGAIPTGVTWQQPGILMPLKKSITWIIVEVTGIADGPNAQSEKIVEFTWQYDLSPFPEGIQNVLKDAPHQGTALLRLYDDGWRFVKF